MGISIIGMSGSGKSLWALKLAEKGFRRFCCDDLITKKLIHELTRPDGITMELGEWMGFPYEPQYTECESKYLACEIDVLNEILESLERREKNHDEKFVIDTTGSVIYTGEEILTRLCQNTTVVHLATPPEVQEEMLEAYITNKRPVLWRDMFSKGSNETNDEALARCYPRLLSSRERLYEQYADVTIDYYRLNEDGFGVSDFLKAIDARKD